MQEQAGNLARMLSGAQQHVHLRGGTTAGVAASLLPISSGMASRAQAGQALEQLKKTADRLLQEQQAAKNASDHSMRQLQDAREQKYKLEEQCQQYRKEIAVLQAASEEDSRRFRNMEDKVLVVCSVHSKLHEHVSRLDLQLKESEDARLQLEKALAERLSQNEVTMQNAVAEIQSARQQRAAISAELEEVQQSLTYEQDCLKAIKAQLASETKRAAAEKEVTLRHIEEKEARILELTREIEAQVTRAASQQETMEGLLNNKAEEVKALQSQINEQVASYTTEKADLLQQVEAALQEGKHQVEEFTSRLEALRADKDAAIKLMADELEAMRLESNARDESIAELHGKLQAEQDASAAYKGQANEELLSTQATVAKLEAKVLEQISAVKDAQEHIAQLDSRLKAEVSKVFQLEADLQERQVATDAAIHAAKKSVNGFQERAAREMDNVLEQHRIELTEAASKSICLNEELILQKDATIQAQNDAAGKGEKIQQLEASLAEEAAEHRADITRVKEAESHITEMKERIATQEKALSDLKAQFTMSLADKDLQLEQQKIEAERAMTALSEEADSRIAALMGQLEEAQEATQQLQEKMRSTLAEIQRKEDCLQGMRRDALQREAQLNELRDEMHGKDQLLKVISNAAAATQKTPGKSKSRGQMPVARYQEADPSRKHKLLKKRKVPPTYEEVTQREPAQLQKQEQHHHHVDVQAGKPSGGGRKSIFTSMSKEPCDKSQKVVAAEKHRAKHTQAAPSAILDLFGNASMAPYSNFKGKLDPMH